MDRQVSVKFKTEFVTKLARRSMFVYPSKAEFEQSVIEYSDFKDMKLRQASNKLVAQEAKAFMAEASMRVSSFLLTQETRRMEFTTEALDILEAYKIYCNSLGSGKDFVHKSVMLEQTHRQWKTLKLAGTYALMDESLIVTADHVRQSMYYMEKIGHYLNVYENYAAKEEYELLVEYFQSNPTVTLTLHNLKKRGYITGSSGLDHKIKELVKLADSYAGSAGYLKYENAAMSYHPFETVGEHRASYIQVSGTKQERAMNCHSGFVNESTTFAKLAVLASNDTAYTPFKFTDGKRKNDNIISGATWVALDVDDSEVSIDEMHDILDGINHHVVTTSNPDNPYKFRVLLEFSNVVDLPVREWKQFGKELGKELGINIDPVTFTKSQIMFGYAGSKILSTVDEDPYDVSSCIKKASENVSESFGKAPKTSRVQMRNELDDPLQTFAYAFKEDQQNRSLSMFRMWKHAKDLGANMEECTKLMHDLNYGFWEDPVSDARYNSYIHQMEQSFASSENDF